MKHHTHILAGIILTEGCLIFSGFKLQTQTFLDPYVLKECLPFFAAFFIGSIFPDFDFMLPIPHRTVMHWPLVYAGFALLTFFNYPLVFVFCIASLVHVLMDSFTMMGVPIINPFGKKYGFGLMITGGYKELTFSVLLLCLIILIFIRF